MPDALRLRYRRASAARAAACIAVGITAAAGSASAQTVPPQAHELPLSASFPHLQPRTKATTRLVGSPPLTDVDAAARVARRGWEPRPENLTVNHRVPSAEDLAAFHEKQAGLDAWNLNPNAQHVTGNFTGTTDEIIQWAAHKWGIDEDIIRAVAVMESEWRQSGVHADGPYLSYGILQVLNQYAGTFPLSRDSTAFNADFYGAHIRFVFDGRNRWFNDVARGRTYAAGDIWGSVGSWFAGAWWTREASAYISDVKDHLANRPWEKADFWLF